ncbi:MAG: hypothetical protein R3F24_12705 [Gammaproteobacteria bacterium]
MSREMARQRQGSFIGCSTAPDASLVEINPLIVTKAGDLMALDAKINIEENALFGQGDLHHARSQPGRRHGAARPSTI